MILKNFKFGKINEFIDFFPIWKTKIWLQKLENFGIIRLFDIPHYSKFRQFDR